MNDAGTLKREVGVFGATMMGLGSMVGTGVFVSIGARQGSWAPRSFSPSRSRPCSPRAMP
jgi:amino acid permease